MLQGTPEVSTSYDMRGDGINLRGFNADTGDIYRDGIRESGQCAVALQILNGLRFLKAIFCALWA